MADHRRSHRVLTDAGGELAYEAYLSTWARAFGEAERAAETSLDEYSMDQVGASFLAEVLPGGAGARVLAAFRDAYLEEWARGVTAIPGLAAMLDALGARCTLAVVSNTHHASLVHGLLHRVGIADAFKAVVTSVEFGRRKPCRTVFEHALRLTGCAPGDALFVGDSYVPDYVGPRAVGMPALLIDPDARGPAPAEDRLASLLEVGERLGASCQRGQRTHRSTGGGVAFGRVHG